MGKLLVTNCVSSEDLSSGTRSARHHETVPCVEQPCSDRRYHPPQLPGSLSMSESRLLFVCRGMELEGMEFLGAWGTPRGRLGFLRGGVSVSLGFASLGRDQLQGRTVRKSPRPALGSH